MMAGHGIARIVVAIACMTTLTAAAPPPAVPVTIPDDGLVDACPTLAAPAHLKSGGDGFLSLRAGPGTAFREIARLTGKDRVLICAERQGWSAVVVRAADVECGVSAPHAGRSPYRGPCRSGWVASRFLDVLAG